MGKSLTDFIRTVTDDKQYETRRAKMARLVEKWEPWGLLEGLSRPKKETLAQLLQNQAYDVRRMLKEQNYVGDVGGFTKIAFPIVRRVFANLLANEIVSVQPLDNPSAAIFYFDFTYDISKPGFTSGGSVYGDRETVSNVALQAQGAMTGFGGPYNLNTGYSRRIFQYTAPSGSVSASSKTATSPYISGTLTGFAFTPASVSAADLMAINSYRPALSSSITFETAPGNEFRGMNAITSATGPDSTSDYAMTEFDGTSFIVYSTTNMAAASASAGNAYILTGPVGTYLEINKQFGDGSTLLGDFEAVDEIPQINIKIDSRVINVITRKLKAIWTQEQAQDIEKMHQIDAEVELTTILSEVIARDIDREILLDLLNAAAVRSAWSRKIGRFVYLDETTNTVRDVYTYSNFAPGVGMFTTQTWYQTLGETLVSVSNEIFRRNLISGATWIVTSPDVSTVIEAMQTFKPSLISSSEQNNFTIGVEKVGTVNSRFEIYKDPYFPANKILMGFKGKSVLESGYVYAPYIPLVVTPTIFDPDDFTPRKGVMTRYAKALIRNDFYGTVTVVDLNVIGI
jgi:hypothetical protein